MRMDCFEFFGSEPCEITKIRSIQDIRVKYIRFRGVMVGMRDDQGHPLLEKRQAACPGEGVLGLERG